jgi:hypothetical protein
VNFIPDADRFVIVSYACPCYGQPNTRVPMRIIREKVVGWVHDAEYLASSDLNYVPLVPVILGSCGLQEFWLTEEDKLGKARLMHVDDELMTHTELIILHKGFHGEIS